jgi:hypothetical protein
MTAEVIIKSIIGSEVEEILVVLVKLREKTVGIVDGLDESAVVMDGKLIGVGIEIGIGKGGPVNDGLEHSLLPGPGHLGAPVADQQFHHAGMGLKGPDCDDLFILPGKVYPQDLKGIVMGGTDDALDVLINIHGSCGLR